MNDGNKKVVVITGATKGLGKALSLTFANAGYEVIGIYRSDTESAKAIESEFKAKGFQGTFLKQDITEDGGWAEFDKTIEDKSNKHLTLIANACASFVPKPFHLINWLEVSEQIDVSVKGTFLMLKRLLPVMAKAREGNVITVLSAALNPPPKGFAGYVTAKSALEGLTKAVAAEYAMRGIKVFSVSPGFMETSLTQGWSDHLKALIYSNDEGVQQPAEVADVILALADDAKTNGQGENYMINGATRRRVSEEFAKHIVED
jgi:3-oxoacyl-[acyl-carrier protein] reductase